MSHALASVMGAAVAMTITLDHRFVVLAIVAGLGACIMYAVEKYL